MNEENYKIIKEMYDDLTKEYAEKSALLHDKKNRILEIDSYVESILSKEQNDLQVFLHRKVEDVYHDVLKRNYDEKEKLILECDDIEKSLQKEKNRLESLEEVISDDSFMLHVKQISVLEIQEKERQRIARDLHDSSLQNLTHLIHKV
ncbi:MAG: histidine kinase, partial [Lachnospiraceae bacterium]|nr:histidine kinase [Lachnospiraceae bacterium]